MTADCAGRKEGECSPWRTHRLWSLWDIMQRFRAASFTTALGHLQTAAAMIQMADALGLKGDPVADIEYIRSPIDQAAQSFAEVSLSAILKSQTKRLQEAVDRGADGHELRIMIRELINNILEELASAWFLMIPGDQRNLYEQREPPFGPLVASTFSEASMDVAAAGRCFALDEWTACVFHLMRALEHGLRKMCRMVGLQHEMAYENWRNVIDQLEARIREIEKEKKSSEKIETLRLFSDAAMQFRYFKDAWRNHVSHARVSYDQHTAPPIWVHVRLFMGQIAGLPDLSS